ncbi:hypothetical protein Ga0061079_10739 [Apibacter mensalis]|uniref:Uncharacterized protein n=1 Tax=Apibacter mensalis TaxID=1586267 RepID=A0A0X3AQP4_9FLAO|nr:hypothetical protein Ga0061079_10739 [Apibacter mensalis]
MRRIEIVKIKTFTIKNKTYMNLKRIILTIGHKLLQKIFNYNSLDQKNQ